MTRCVFRSAAPCCWSLLYRSPQRIEIRVGPATLSTTTRRIADRSA